MTAESLPLTHVTDPPETTVDGRSPAVVVVHGRGADEQDLLSIAAQLPDELHVLSVRAPDRLQGGYTWYELDLSGGGLHESQPDQRDFERSLRLVHEFVDAAVDAYDLDPDRVGLLAFILSAVSPSRSSPPRVANILTRLQPTVSVRAPSRACRRSRSAPTPTTGWSRATGISRRHTRTTSIRRPENRCSSGPVDRTSSSPSNARKRRRHGWTTPVST